jgi:putative transport protein
MSWLFKLHKTQPVAHAGIIVGHFGNLVDQHTLRFVKESSGLLPFVVIIGLHLGLGFLAAF